MAQADFAYPSAGRGAGGKPLAVSVFADRETKLAEMRGDVAAAGLGVLDCGPLSRVLETETPALGNVVLVDCPAADATSLAALVRLDMRAAQSGAQVVISTGLDALDDVFGCCDQSAPQILVDPGRADRIVALGRVLANMPKDRLRELDEADRLVLLRLTEQVAQLAHKVEGLTGDATGPSSAFRFESPAPGYRGEDDASGKPLSHAARPPLPDPRLVRRIIRQRQLRGRFFEGDLFADPAWDMLLDLTAARAEHLRVSVTSLCIASGVPPTTALRWIGQLSDAGLVQRMQDETDRRRAFIALTDKAADAMARYFVEIGRVAKLA